MSVSRLAVLFISILVLSPGLSAQQAPQRDPQAVAAVQQAIAALGGAQALAAVADSVAVGQIAPTPGSWVKTSNFVWKDSGAEFRRERQTATATQVLLSGHGQPSATSNGITKKLFYHMTYTTPPFYVPGVVLLRELSDSRYSLILLGPATVSGRSAIRVRTSLQTNPVAAAVTQQDWFLDVATGLPLRVEYRLPSTADAADFQSAAATFSDFRQVSGVLVPSSIAGEQQGAAVSLVTVTSVTFNSGVNPAEFDLP